MKNKFLFGALLSGAVLVSCNVKDGLDAGVEKAPQSPVFTVTLEDNFAATRAEMGLGDANVAFEAKDKMTLYHGVTAAEGFTGYENAVYEGATGGEGSALAFATHSMVKTGKAIMVYPADLTFANDGTSAPVITVNVTGQTKETADNTPYISEILNILDMNDTTYKDADNNLKSGYGKDYDLVLKRLASTLLLTLEEDGEFELPEGVSPLTVTGVEINGSNTFANFTKSIELKIGDAIVKPEAAQQKDNHPLWVNHSVVGDIKEKSNTVKTNYVENNVAVFTLLPFAQSGIVFQSSENTITVYTNYGKVEIEGATKDVWAGDPKGTNDDGVITTGLSYLAANLWSELKNSANFYEGTLAGHGAKRTLLVDYSNLDMDGTHIKTSEQLIDVLTVYDALSKNEGFNTEVEFFLDGDAKTGEFVMTADALAAYLKHIGKVNGKANPVTFTPCTDDGEKCEVVVLTEGGTVPVALDFNGSVEVDLEGAWTLAGEHAFNGVNCIYVPYGSTLTLNGTIQSATTQGITNVYTVGTVKDGIYVDGTVVSGTAGQTTTLKFNMENHGTVEVPANSALLMNSATFTNSYDTIPNTPANNKKTGYERLASEGQVNVYGRLAATTGGKLENYGVVTMESTEAYIYLTNNAIGGSKYSLPFTDGTNVIGSVVLADKTANENVSIAGEQGFIKLKLGMATVTDKDLGSVANYAILEGAVEAYDALTVGEKETVQNKIKYLEVNSTKQVKIVGKYANSNSRLFDGLWVHEGSNVNVPEGSQVTVRNAYLQGYVFCAGTWYEGVKYTTYFGEGDEDHYAYTGTVKD